MAKSKKEKALQKVISDIDVALQYQKEDDWLAKSHRYLGYIDGKYPPSLDTPYVVNTFYSLVNLIVPNLYYQDPTIKVSCTKSDIIIEDEEDLPKHIPGYLVASIRQDVLNALYPSLKIGREMQKAVQDTITYGFAPIKTGISTDTEPDKEFPQLPKKSIYVVSLCPEDVPYDPMATGSFDDCSFITHRYIKDLDQLKQNKDLDNLDSITGHTIAEGSPKGDLYKSIKRHSMRKYVTLYEYHDQIEKKLRLIVKEPELGESSDTPSKAKAVKGGEPLQIKEWDMDKALPGSAFTLLRFTTINDRIRGISMLGTQEDEALAINQVLTAQVRHINIFGGIFVHERGALTEEQLRAWQLSKQGDMLEVEPNTLAGPSGARIRRESPLQMGGDYFSCISSFTQLIDRVLGVPDFQNIHSTKRKTATESSFEQGDSRVRRDFLMGFVKDAVVEISYKVLALAHAHYNHREIEKLVGYTFPKDLWDKVSDNDLYHLDIDIESMIVYNQSMATGLMQALNYLASNPVTQPSVLRLDGEKISAKVFKGFGANIEYFYKEDDFIHTENNADDENEAMEEGRVIPSPQPFEPHEEHLKKHQRKFIELMSAGKQSEAQRLMDHMQLHIFYQQSFQQLGQPQGGMMAQGQGGSVPMNNPAGNPMMSEQQPVSPDQAEVQGNFRRG